jgi:Glyoxalase-like domain
MMEIDHIFVFVDERGPELRRMHFSGLRETYRRQHAGQGTANACFAFDNLFIELLWLTSPEEAASDSIRRTLLLERSRWCENGACPFGIAWRMAEGENPTDTATWAFRPPYLPVGQSIDVAVDSDDPQQPMMFTFPGSKAPMTWPDARKGQLQHAAGFATVGRVRLSLPSHVQPSQSLAVLARGADIALESLPGANYAMQLDLSDPDGKRRATLSLPECVLMRNND